MAIKYKWLADVLRSEIHKKISRGIEKLPTEQDLCKTYQVSRQTVREALHLLQEEGLIEKRQGSGSYITGILPGMERNEIALLISSEHEYLYPDAISCIRETLLRSGFMMKIYETGNLVSREHEILNRLLSSPIRGIIAEGCKSALPNPNVSLYRKLDAKGIPTVFLYTRYSNYEDCISVTDENAEGSALLVRHLLSKGHKNIGGIFKSDDYQGQGRYRGFVEALYQENIIVGDEQICFFDSRTLAALREKQDTGFLRSMIKENFGDCTGIVCYNDEIAYWLIHELMSAGYRLPSDMAVTAFDNTYLSSHEVVSITTLSHRFGEMGTSAAETLLRKIKGLPSISKEIPWFLITRDSTL